MKVYRFPLSDSIDTDQIVLIGRLIRVYSGAICHKIYSYLDELR